MLDSEEGGPVEAQAGFLWVGSLLRENLSGYLPHPLHYRDVLSIQCSWISWERETLYNRREFAKRFLIVPVTFSDLMWVRGMRR